MTLSRLISTSSAALLLFVAIGAAHAQSPPAATPTAPVESAPPAGNQPDFKPEELEQMLVPIALYPDSLMSQVLMASTYPIEVVEADRFVKANPNLKGDELAKQLETKTWDASVRSLVNFPPVLAMMSENLSTTVKIGDAFIGQQKAVMDTIQKLRAKAKSNGNLESNEQQKVSTTGSGDTQVIVVESSSPEVIYVPTYNPTVVYGAWPYPAYPPYPYYPPGYVASNVVSFGLGVACGVAWGYAWGNCNWGGGDVDIDINRNNNFNTNIDKSKFKNAQGGVGNSGRGSFKHDPAHRQGASYRNQASANRVGATATNNRAVAARNDYRGKAETGRADLNRGGADAFKSNAGAANANRGNLGSGSAGAATRPSNTGNGNALSGANRGGDAARQSSNRGTASRQASPSAGARSAPSRSSGGSRGGGGGRGGGGRR